LPRKGAFPFFGRTVAQNPKPFGLTQLARHKATSPTLHIPTVPAQASQRRNNFYRNVRPLATAQVRPTVEKPSPHPAKAELVTGDPEFKALEKEMKIA